MIAGVLPQPPIADTLNFQLTEVTVRPRHHYLLYLSSLISKLNLALRCQTVAKIQKALTSTFSVTRIIIRPFPGCEWIR